MYTEFISSESEIKRQRSSEGAYNRSTKRALLFVKQYHRLLLVKVCGST